VTVHDESYMIAMLYSNTTFRSTSIKPFYKTNELIEVKNLELERNGENVHEDTIVINTINNAILAPPPKRSKGRPCKNLDVTLFLQEDFQYKDSY
jgi:hypothetical protein